MVNKVFSVQNLANLAKLLVGLKLRIYTRLLNRLALLLYYEPTCPNYYSKAYNINIEY